MPELDLHSVPDPQWEFDPLLYDAYVRFSLGFKKLFEANFADVITYNPAVQQFIDGHLAPLSESAFQAMLLRMQPQQRTAYVALINTDPKSLEEREASIANRMQHAEEVPAEFSERYVEQIRKVVGRK